MKNSARGEHFVVLLILMARRLENKTLWSYRPTQSCNKSRPKSMLQVVFYERVRAIKLEDHALMWKSVFFLFLVWGGGMLKFHDCFRQDVLESPWKLRQNTELRSYFFQIFDSGFEDKFYLKASTRSQMICV